MIWVEICPRENPAILNSKQQEGSHMLKKFLHLLTMCTCFIAINIVDTSTHPINAESCIDMHKRCVTGGNQCYAYLENKNKDERATTSCRAIVESDDFDASSLEMKKAACSIGCETASETKICDGPCPLADLILFRKLKEKNP